MSYDSAAVWQTDGVMGQGNIQGLVGPTLPGALGPSKQVIRIPLIQFLTAIPFVIAPTGTMGNNGAITIGTSLPTTYANCYLNLPANAISAGSAAGWYFAQMSSATVGTVFNNTYVSGAPLIPSSPLAFLTTGPGAYTGVTTSQAGVTFSIPGGAVGNNGTVYYEATYQYPNNANTKTATISYGGVTIFTRGETTSVSGAISKKLHNRGIQTAQVSSDPGGQSGVVLGAVASPTVTSIDTSQNQNFIFTMQLATATDFICMERLEVQIHYST